MHWLILVIAGIFEVAWAVGMKYSHGFTRLWPSVFTVLAMIISVYLLSLATKQISLGTAYAVWTGIGVIGTTVYGMLYFSEPVEFLRVFFILLILVAIVGLKVIS